MEQRHKRHYWNCNSMASVNDMVLALAKTVVVLALVLAVTNNPRSVGWELELEKYPLI